tara:strand:- start:3 stop:419 length:417 start_codon:yes stop_codon:yes gene_type:complete
MKQYTKKINIINNGLNIKDITQEIKIFIKNSEIINGFLNLTILHTTASLIIQENADSDVLKDLQIFFNKLVPMDEKYNHSIEGIDDMPAHIKSAITNPSLSLSVLNRKIQLGTWQGIYLFEHRTSYRERIVLAHIMGD